MSTRQGVIVKGVVVLGVAALAAGFASSAEAQVSGRVVFADGPIGVSLAFGERAAPILRPGRVVYRSAPPSRFRAGMSLRELDLYLARIEYEYELYRKMHPREARRLGWSVPELRHYVKWLRDERRWLREERARLTRDYRWDRERDRYWDDDWDDDRPGRGRGRGR